MESALDCSEAMAAIQARPLMFSKSVMLNCKPLLLHGGAFMTSPDAGDGTCHVGMEGQTQFGQTLADFGWP